MSIFASRVTATVAIDADPPHTVTIRKLTGHDVERAQAEHLKALVVPNQPPRAWHLVLRRLLTNGTRLAADDATIEAALADPLLGFDRYVIVRAGLVGWTYNGGAPTDAEIDDLDDDAVTLIARAILRLSKPALFQTDAERDDAKKNA